MATKMLLTVAVALAVLTVSVTSATAASLSITPAGAITATSLGRLTFGTSVIRIIECDVQLQGSLNGHLEKTQGTIIGAITAAPVSNCNLGVRVTALIDTPWAIRYESIAGTLPEDMNSIRLSLDTAAFVLENTPVQTCLYAGRLEFLIQTAKVGSSLYTTGLVSADPSVTMSSRGSGIFCPGTSSFSGQLALTPTQSIARS